MNSIFIIIDNKGAIASNKFFSSREEAEKSISKLDFADRLSIRELLNEKVYADWY